MLFRVDAASPKPVYQQLIDQVKFGVASGSLQPGDRLPPIRDVAVQLRVNRNTVARVYMELEREGLVVTRAGAGAFISDRGSMLSRKEQRRRLFELLDELLAAASLYGFSREQVQDLIADRLTVVYPDPPVAETETRIPSKEDKPSAQSRNPRR